MTDDVAISYQAAPAGIPVLTATGREIAEYERFRLELAVASAS